VRPPPPPPHIPVLFSRLIFFSGVLLLFLYKLEYNNHRSSGSELDDLQHLFCSGFIEYYILWLKKKQ
jgi:hypothetical protein